MLSGHPSLGELARLKAIAALIQTRIVKLTEAGALVAPFFMGDDAIAIADDARAQLDAQAPAVLAAALRAR